MYRPCPPYFGTNLPPNRDQDIHSRPNSAFITTSIKPTTSYNNIINILSVALVVPRPARRRPASHHGRGVCRRGGSEDRVDTERLPLTDDGVAEEEAAV